MLKGKAIPQYRGMGLISKHARVLSIFGAIAFIGGYVLAVLAGIWWPENGGPVATLVILGLLVGFLNVTSREIVPYLLAAIALVLIGGNQAFTPLNLVADGLGERANRIVRMMSIFTAPAAAVQAIGAGMLLARPGESATKVGMSQ